MIRKLFRQMLVTQILSAMTVMLCMLVDSMMIGRFLGVDSMTAYGLANPVLLIFAAYGAMLSAGVQVMCGKTVGVGDREGTNACFSAAVVLALSVSIAGLILILLLVGPVQYIVKSTEYDDSYKTPVLTAGQTFILGYTNEEFGIYNADKIAPTIIFDDFTTSFHWVDFDFKVKSSAMKMLRPKSTFDGSFRYVFYAMECIGFEAVDHTRHWISKYSQFEIPLPPPPVQEEIVKILDRFAEYAAELQAELQARQEQYGYYRNKLLTFNEIGGVFKV